jgi:hypothetical protein
VVDISSLFSTPRRSLVKKQAAQTVAPVQPKTRTLFGLKSEELKAVHGGGGVIINNPAPAPIKQG